MENKHDERVLKFLLSQKRRETNPNEIYLGTNSYSEIPNITQSEFISQLSILQQRGLIICKFLGSQDGRCPCHITLLDSGLNYFENSEKEKETKRKHITWEFIKFIIPVIISLISLIIAILAYVHTS